MSEMTLFHSPNACSEGILLLLRLTGAPFNVHVVNVGKGEQHTPEFRAVNPKGKVPALKRPDGSVLTEFTAIAFWLSRTFPDAGLLGDDLEVQARALELLDFMVASVHMRGFTLLKVPQKFASEPDCQAALKSHGRQVAQDGLMRLSETLGDDAFLGGDRPAVTDGAAYYLLRWGTQEGLEVPENLLELLSRLEGLMEGKAFTQ